MSVPYLFPLLAGLSILASPLHADIIGRASVIDADTIEIHGERIRLHGVDSPESRQKCYRDGREWRCGQAAANALDKRIAERTLRCEVRDIDRYKRVVAECFAGRYNINRWLVRQGWAMAYRQYGKDYVEAEELARADRKGIWSAEFVPPWDWRKGTRLPQDGS